VLDSGDIRFIPSQKGVDVRLALDMDHLSLESDVDCLVLVAGDCYFVPAVDLASSRSVRVILDPMWGSASQKLRRSLDAVENLFPKPENSDQTWPMRYVDPEILCGDCFLNARPAEEVIVDLKERGSQGGRIQRRKECSGSSLSVMRHKLSPYRRLRMGASQQRC